MYAYTQPWCLSSKESSSLQRDLVGAMDSVPGSGRSPGEGNDNPLQYSCLENPMDRAARRAAVHGVAKEPDTTYQLNNNKSMHTHTY